MVGYTYIFQCFRCTVTWEHCFLYTCYSCIEFRYGSLFKISVQHRIFYRATKVIKNVKRIKTRLLPYFSITFQGNIRNISTLTSLRKPNFPTSSTNGCLTFELSICMVRWKITNQPGSPQLCCERTSFYFSVAYIHSYHTFNYHPICSCNAFIRF